MSAKVTRMLVGLLLGLVALPSTQAQPSASDPADTSRVFPYEAQILGVTPGRVARLPIPAAVLAVSAADLADVRIHDASGEELPYLIDSATRSPQGEPATRQLDATILNTSRRVEGAGSLAPIFVERFELSPPRIESELADGSSARRRWTLVFATPRDRFVAQVEVTWASMERQMPLAEGSIYRFPTPERSGLTLPLEFPPEQPAEGTRVVVEIRGGDGYLEPTLRFRGRSSRGAPPTLTIPLEESRRTSENGTTTIHLVRPRGIVPDRLQIITTTPNFHRDVRVLDLAQGQPPSTIGHGLAYRLQEVPGAEEITIPLRRASGQTLAVEIEDADSPPLEGLHFSAEVTQPALVFTGAEGAILRFGGGRVRAPRYDLMDIRSSLTDGSGGGGAQVRLAEIRPNPSFDAGPALAFALTAGRPLALDDFAYRAKIHISGADEGLSRVDLSPEVMAGASASLRDLRVVDAQGRQRPYVLGAEEPRTLELPLPRAEVRGESSVYVLTLPASPLRVSRLTLDTQADFLARRLRVMGTLENGRVVTLMNTFLARPPDTHEPLVVELQDARVRDIRLEFDDGGDAPLELSRVSLELVSSPLFLVAPDGDYTLYFGDPALQAPVYELSRARALVLSLPAALGELGAREPNPAHVPPAWYAGAAGQTWLVWCVLILGLLVLVALTLRVLRSEPQEGDEPPASPDPAPDPAATDETGSESHEHDGHTESNG